MYNLFTNILGSFIIDAKGSIVDSIQFKTLSEYEGRVAAEKKLLTKYPTATIPSPQKQAELLSLFQDKKFFTSFKEINTQLTISAIQESLNPDLLIIQAISNIDELDKVSNLLSRRLREWYSLYFPELDQKVSHPEKYVELLLTKDKPTLIKELEVTRSMGGTLKPLDLEQIKQLASHIQKTHELRLSHEQYLEKVMLSHCPNILELAGTTIGARLIELARSLKHLALLPSSTIKLFGAEKALFRHLKTGAKSPKYGIIINHPLVAKAQKENKGKAARLLADKLSLCARLDFFKGELK